VSLRGYHLGCPIWSNKAWVGELFRADARPAGYLAQYAQVFNTVEGNTTFYGVPKPATVQRWHADTPPGFRFCFKFPRTISHDRRLRNAGTETREFLDRMAPLAERLGPLMLQLPPAFGPDGLETLAAYLDTLSTEFRYAVEVRHPAWFAKDEAERRFNRLLMDRGVERVMLDSRALFSTPPPDPAAREAQRKKPRLPVHVIATGTRPLVRFIGHPELERNDAFLAPWLDKFAEWLGEGRSPYLFVHTPDNNAAPRLARRVHEQLHRRCAVGTLPVWPGAQ
jgi:uncharacterized protein YecE (DUF72 family)